MNILCPIEGTLDLNTCMEAEALQNLQERLVYYENAEGNRVPMAIDITDTDYVKEAGIQEEKIYISFPTNAVNQERAREFVAYVVAH